MSVGLSFSCSGRKDGAIRGPVSVCISVSLPRSCLCLYLHLYLSPLFLSLSLSLSLSLTCSGQNGAVKSVSLPRACTILNKLIPPPQQYILPRARVYTLSPLFALPLSGQNDAVNKDFKWREPLRVSCVTTKLEIETETGTRERDRDRDTDRDRSERATHGVLSDY